MTIRLSLSQVGTYVTQTAHFAVPIDQSHPSLARLHDARGAEGGHIIFDPHPPMSLFLRASTGSLLLAAISLTGCSDAIDVTTPDVAAAARLAAAASSNAAGDDSTQIDYIVTFVTTETNPTGRARALLAQQNGKLKREYKFALKGFSATLTPAAAKRLAAADGILRVEEDGKVFITETVSASSWGLDRLDQRPLPLNGLYSFAGNGAGVRVYIVDTGILTAHEQFTGRALAGFSAFGDNNPEDCNGHGTHVAGTIGGSTTGVARGANVVPVRVLDCSGSGLWSGVIAGIDWVTGQKTANGSIPMAANMSLGGGFSASVNDAVTKAIAAGVTFAVAAGNSGADACNTSPASTPNALTVGATESNDSRASYSNFGSCLDIFAPGSGIYSSYIGSTSAYASLSGTSMASPHVAGVAALILGTYPTYSPSQVRSVMLAGGTANLVVSPGSGSPNVLLTNMFSGAVTPPADTVITPTPTPTPVITLSIARQVTKTQNTAKLSWSGATTSNVDIYRNTVRFLTTANDGLHNDAKRPNGSWTYKVCNAGTTICSPDVTVVF